MPAIPDPSTGSPGWDFAVVCTQRGLHPKIQQRILQLEDLAAFLDATLADGRAARSAYDLARVGEVTFRALGLLSDVVLERLAAGAGPVGLGVTYLKDIGVLIAQGVHSDLGPADALGFNLKVKSDALREIVGPAHPGWKVFDRVLRLGRISSEIQAIVRSSGGGAGIDGANATVALQLERMRRELRQLWRLAEECGLTASPEVPGRIPGPQLRAY